MGFTSHRGFESRPLRSLPSATRRRADGRYARSRLAPVAQLDRASVYGTEGHRFESCRARRTETQRGPAGRRLNSRVAAVPFTLRNLKADLQDVGSNFDGAPDLEFRLATKALELEQSGLSYQRI